MIKCSFYRQNKFFVYSLLFIILSQNLHIISSMLSFSEQAFNPIYINCFSSLSESPAKIENESSKVNLNQRKLLNINETNEYKSVLLSSRIKILGEYNIDHEKALFHIIHFILNINNSFRPPPALHLS
jgi:hypothetical protein